MLQISDLEEKRLIVAYSMARTSKHIGLENIWRQWCIWYIPYKELNAMPSA